MLWSRTLTAYGLLSCFWVPNFLYCAFDQLCIDITDILLWFSAFEFYRVSCRVALSAQRIPTDVISDFYTGAANISSK
jgi:hypothetical protein